jgi:CO/xanthine dehydrogenase FAD-binding subunit
VPVLIPRTLDDACAALAEHPDAVCLADGIDLMIGVNAGRVELGTTVHLGRIPELRGWSEDHDGTLVIGAATTYTDLMSGRAAALLPALAQASRTVGSPQIRNAGTIGGNLATASPAGDTLPVLLALDARVDLVGVDGSRTLTLPEFLLGPKRTALQPGELIRSVRCPVVEGPQEFLKVGTRNAMVISIASLAAVADPATRSVRIALGAVSPVPVRATRAEQVAAASLDWDGLVAGTPEPASDQVLGQVAAAATAVCSPITDHRSTAAYRRHAVGVLARCLF